MSASPRPARRAVALSRIRSPETARCATGCHPCSGSRHSAMSAAQGQEVGEAVRASCDTSAKVQHHNTSRAKMRRKAHVAAHHFDEQAGRALAAHTAAIWADRPEHQPGDPTGEAREPIAADSVAVEDGRPHGGAPASRIRFGERPDAPAPRKPGMSSWSRNSDNQTSAPARRRRKTRGRTTKPANAIDRPNTTWIRRRKIRHWCRRMRASGRSR